MYRLVRFLILALTLGRIKWLMRLTWVWRLIVFLGISSWMSKKLRKAIGLDKKSAKDIDSAWADALRYTPQPATAAAGFAAPAAAAPVAKASVPSPEISESTSEVIGTAADGSSETITIHEVSADGDTESIVRIEDDGGNVETLVTGAPVEDIDLANLGEPAVEATAPVVEEISVDEMLTDLADIEAIADLEVIDLIETLESAEPMPSAVEIEPEAPKRKRVTKVKPEGVVEPVVETAAAVVIDPDWVRGDGTQDCPDSHPVKAKASSMIFYIPDSGHYDRTIPDVCFASDLDAEAAGYRAPRR